MGPPSGHRERVLLGLLMKSSRTFVILVPYEIGIGFGDTLKQNHRGPAIEISVVLFVRMCLVVPEILNHTMPLKPYSNH